MRTSISAFISAFLLGYEKGFSWNELIGSSRTLVRGRKSPSRKMIRCVSCLNNWVPVSVSATKRGCSFSLRNLNTRISARRLKDRQNADFMIWDQRDQTSIILSWINGGELTLLLTVIQVSFRVSSDSRLIDLSRHAVNLRRDFPRFRNIYQRSSSESRIHVYNDIPPRALLLRKRRVASLSRDEEEAGGEKGGGGGGGDVTHSPSLMERAERVEREGQEQETNANRADNCVGRRGARREPVRPSPRLIYLNLRNSVSCRGLYIGQAQVAVPKVSQGRRNARDQAASVTP